MEYNITELIQIALKSRKIAYAPYSTYKVGAAVATDAGIFSGCNIENAAYSPGNCAERTAIFKAVSEGARKIYAIAVVAGKEDDFLDNPTPCGMCRQVMREFANPLDMKIILAKSESDYEIKTLEELLPMSFGPENLK